jgi:hypothetical protein
MAVGIISALIRFAPGLEGDSMLEPTAIVPSAPASCCQAYGSKLWVAHWSDDSAGDSEALYRDKCRKHGLVHDTDSDNRSCSPPYADGWASNSH